MSQLVVIFNVLIDLLSGKVVNESLTVFLRARRRLEGEAQLALMSVHVLVHVSVNGQASTVARR